MRAHLVRGSSEDHFASFPLPTRSSEATKSTTAGDLVTLEPLFAGRYDFLGQRDAALRRTGSIGPPRTT